MGEWQKNNIGRKFALSMACICVSACVSDTLSNVDTQSQTVAATPQETPKYDPIQREQAIAEIRAKAEQEGSSELTNVNEEADGPNEPLTPSQQAAKISELQQTAAQNQKNIEDAELAAKRRSILEMQQKAKTHYDDALKSITN